MEANVKSFKLAWRFSRSRRFSRIFVEFRVASSANAVCVCSGARLLVGLISALDVIAYASLNAQNDIISRCYLTDVI